MKLAVAVTSLVASVLAGVVPESSQYLSPKLPLINSGGRIVGGVEAQPRTFQYLVNLRLQMRTTGRRITCGGCLISSIWILSAGHCTVNAESATATLGAHNITNTNERGRQVQYIPSPNIITHGQYIDRGLYNDISALRLPQMVIFDSYIQPITLPVQNSAYYAGRFAYAAGWGRSSDLSTATSQVVRYAALPVITNEECKRTFARVTEGMICIRVANGMSTCHGDSGGPLAAINAQGIHTLIGLVSFGSRQCRQGTAAVFTRVSAYTNWIATTTGVRSNLTVS